MIITRRSLLATAAAPLAVAQSTRGSRLLRDWLTAFNSNDRTTIHAFFEKHATDAETRTARSLGMRQDTGAFELVKVEQEGATSVQALLKQADGDMHARVIMKFNDGEPLRLEGIMLQPAAPPREEGVSRLTLPEACKAVDAHARDRAQKDRFAGAILVSDRGETVLAQAYGMANREQKIANTLDTRFRIGSMNKMFTAVGILQLIERGKLQLGDVIGKHLTGYPNQDFAAKVTVRHLLTHTGGAGDIFTPEYEKRRTETRTLQDYVKLFGTRAVEFEPGSQWQYANYGYVLLGVLIEAVTGKPYYQYVDEAIFQVAGMKHTASEPESSEVSRRSVGYMRVDGVWQPNTNTLPWRGTSAGGGYSTVGDLASFARALSAGKLVRKELLAEATRKQAGGRMPYGYGFIPRDGEMPNYGHGGGAPGMNGELRIYGGGQRIVAVLANLDPPAASLITDYLEVRMPAVS